jgi:quinoprotein glucose dehydrogenase
MASYIRKPETSAQWAVAGLASLLFLIGAVLVIGGVWLAALGGSWYYLAAGIGLCVSGVALGMRRLVGVWIYAGLFTFTLIWAIWESGLNGWALLPRLLGPTVLLVLVVLTLPVLAPERGGKQRTIGLIATVAIILVIGVAAYAASRAPAPGPMPSIRGAMSDPSLRAASVDWPAYGATYAAQRYSPLGRINAENVDQLEKAWTYRTGDTPEDAFGAETTPIKVGDSLYLCTSRNIAVSLHAGTGEERWRYDPGVSDDNIPYTAACRGVTHHDTPQSAACPARIIMGTLDARLIALDARTGQPCTDFGSSGEIDITTGMGDVVPGMVSITSAPTIVRDVIVTGHQVLDGQKEEAPSGVVQGFDAVTGELRWAWDMGRPGETGRPPPGETYTRGTPNMWTTATGDEELGLVYLPMGNSAVDYWSRTRSAAENEYSTALVALDVQSGAIIWSFQTVYVDVWDYDLGSQPTLIDFPAGGSTIPAVLLASKQGEIYVLNRATGELLHGVEERPAPQGGVEPEQRTATQPASLYHTLKKPDLQEKDMWGMSPIDQMICRIQFRQAAYDGIYTPPTVDKRWIQYPGYNGGSDWGGIAVDPLRAIIIANYNDMPNYNRLITREEADERGWAPRGEGTEGGAREDTDVQAGAPYAIDVNAGWRLPFTNLLCKQPPYGGIRAIDLATGRTIWDRPFGTARRNGPFGIPSMLPLTIGTPNNGGAILTASGLIFIAATTDNLLHAIDINSGKTVWTDTLPAGGQANPMTYEHEGRQYVVIMAGGHHFMETPPGDYVIAYALPD